MSPGHASLQVSYASFTNEYINTLHRFVVWEMILVGRSYAQI